MTAQTGTHKPGPFCAGVTEEAGSITLHVSRHDGKGRQFFNVEVITPDPRWVRFMGELADCINGLLPERAADRLIIVKPPAAIWGAAIWPRLCFWLSLANLGALLGWWRL